MALPRPTGELLARDFVDHSFETGQSCQCVARGELILNEKYFHPCRSFPGIVTRLETCCCHSNYITFRVIRLFLSHFSSLLEKYHLKIFNNLKVSKIVIFLINLILNNEINIRIDVLKLWNIDTQFLCEEK